MYQRPQCGGDLFGAFCASAVLVVRARVAVATVARGGGAKHSRKFLVGVYDAPDHPIDVSLFADEQLFERIAVAHPALKDEPVKISDVVADSPHRDAAAALGADDPRGRFPVSRTDGAREFVHSRPSTRVAGSLADTRDLEAVFRPEGTLKRRHSIGGAVSALGFHQPAADEGTYQESTPYSVMSMAREPIMQMFTDPVKYLSALPRGVHVHVDAPEMLDVVKKLVPHFTGDAVAIADR